MTKDNILTIPLCKKHGKPFRIGQRNCYVCHREANKKYRKTILDFARRFKFTNENNGA